MNALKHLTADTLREAQNRGLIASGKMAARMLREAHPDAGDLRPWQIRTLESLQRTICAPDAADLPAPDVCGALEATLGFMRSMPTPTVERMGALLALFEAAPLLLGPQRVRFSALGADAQREFLMDWPDARLPQQRAMFHAVKTICMMGYWSRPQTWDAIGYSLDENPGVPDRLKGAS